MWIIYVSLHPKVGVISAARWRVSPNWSTFAMSTYKQNAASKKWNGEKMQMSCWSFVLNAHGDYVWSTKKEHMVKLHSTVNVVCIIKFINIFLHWLLADVYPIILKINIRFSKWKTQEVLQIYMK